MTRSDLEVVVDGTALTTEPSGARTRFLGLYGAVAARCGLRLTAVLRRGGAGLEEELDPRIGVKRIFRPPPPALRLFGPLHPAASAARRTRADLFVAETLPLPPEPGRPTLLTLHDLRFLHASLTPRHRRVFASRLLARNMRRAAAVVTVSQSIARELHASGLAAGRPLYVVPNAPSPPAPPPVESSSRILEELGIDRPFIVSLGRLERRKNLLALLDAYETASQGSQTRAPRLVLAGSSGGPGGRAVRARIARSTALRRGVVLTGRVSEGVKTLLLGRALASVWPSLYEGFGFGLLEAMIQGIPLACSDIPAHREVAGGSALFFDPTDRAQATAVLDRLFCDDGLRDHLARSGLERVKSFSWERSAELFEEACRSLVD